MKTKNVNELLLLLSASLFSIAALADPAASATAFLCLNPAKSLAWKTAPAPFAVDLSWPKGAVSATLAVADGVRKTPISCTLTDTTATNFTVAATGPSNEDGERVFSLTLTFLDGTGAAIETKTARIGFVRGVDGAPFRLLGKDVDERLWRYAGNHAVLPYPEFATGLAVDGVAVDGLVAPDWYLAKAAPGAHVYALSTAAGLKSETLMLTCDGLSIVIR